MTDNQNEPTWVPAVGITICIITFAAVFIGLRSTSDLNLIPSIAITLVAGSIIAAIINGVVQAIISPMLGQPTQDTQQAQAQEKSKDTNQKP